MLDAGLSFLRTPRPGQQLDYDTVGAARRFNILAVSTVTVKVGQIIMRRPTFVTGINGLLEPANRLLVLLPPLGSQAEQQQGIDRPGILCQHLLRQHLSCCKLLAIDQDIGFKQLCLSVLWLDGKKGVEAGQGVVVVPVMR